MAAKNLLCERENFYSSWGLEILVGKVLHTGRWGRETPRQLRKLQEKFEMQYLGWDYKRSRSIEEGKTTMKVKVSEVVKDLHGEPIRKPGIPLSTWPVDRLAKYHDRGDVTLEEFQRLAAEAHVMVNAKDAASVATVGFLSVEALVNVAAGENPDADNKFKAYCLARKLSEAVDEVELTLSEVADIKARAGKLFQPAVMGPLWMALEAAAEPKKDE